MYSDRSFTLATSNDQFLIIDGTRVGDVINTLQARMGKGEPMFTLTKTDVHAVVSSTVRRLTPMECERLQGFPDSWTKFDAEGNEVTDGHRYKQMGNAVAVPVVSWLIKRLMEVANDMD